MNRFCFILAISLALPSCVGGSLRNHGDLETFPLRDATKEEGVRLKKCLQAARYYQELRKEKEGQPYKRAADIPGKKYCGDFKMKLDQTDAGYEISAELIDDDQMVRWSIGEDGVIEEHMDTDFDEDMEF
ncbi:MAG: hypothetical protein EOP11_12235 [Proteobacteria bacterium]|nr:MAG: hypothetical protein EOP11_12235 [Pseudomonadota bacterium]